MLRNAVMPPLRRDAQDRRDRLVQAATEIFLEEGFDVPLERIADRAKVGRATLQRNFPDREALWIEVLQTLLDGLSRKMAEYEDRDDAFFVAIRILADMTVSTHGLQKVLPLQLRTASYMERMRGWLESIFLRPLARAKAAGLIREDFDARDLHLLPLMVAVGGLQTNDDDPQGGMDRAMRLLIRGLAPSGPARS